MSSKGYRFTDIQKLNLANTIDKQLELTPETSMYYAYCVNKLGKEQADYYWNRRSFYENEFDHNLLNCAEIMQKCEEFLKSRGIANTSQNN